MTVVLYCENYELCYVLNSVREFFFFYSMFVPIGTPYMNIKKESSKGLKI